MAHAHPRDTCEVQLRAGGVVRGVDDDHRRAVGDRGLQRVLVDAPGRTVSHELHRDPVGSGQRYGRAVGVVGGIEDDDFAARFHQAQHARGDGLGGADGDEHLGVRVEALPVVAFTLRGDRPAQLRDSPAGGVLVVAFGDLALGPLEHRGRPAGVREALPEVHRLKLDRLGGHGGEDGLCEGSQALDGHGSPLTGSADVCRACYPRRTPLPAGPIPAPSPQFPGPGIRPRPEPPSRPSPGRGGSASSS